jgi:hypothetical protein
VVVAQLVWLKLLRLAQQVARVAGPPTELPYDEAVAWLDRAWIWLPATAVNPPMPLNQVMAQESRFADCLGRWPLAGRPMQQRVEQQVLRRAVQQV